MTSTAVAHRYPFSGPELDRDCPQPHHLAKAQVPQHDRSPDPLIGHEPREITGVGDRYVIDIQDQVAGTDARLVGWAARNDLLDTDPGAPFSARATRGGRGRDDPRSRDTRVGPVRRASTLR